MIVKTSAPIEAIESPRPTRSRRGVWRSFDSGTNASAAPMATMATGTLTKKTEPHQKCSSNQPPVMGPAATPMPLTALQIPMALARSRASVKTLVMMASVAGKMAAAPMPMRARAVMSAPGVSTLPA